MNDKTKTGLITALTIGAFFAFGAYRFVKGDGKRQIPPSYESIRQTKPKTIKIANWNLQAFGKKKASNPELMRRYADVLDDYDIAFVQEIRDSSQTAFPELCSRLPGYKNKISSRAGRSNSKEQYGVLYKDGIEITEFKDYNPDLQDRWERPPVALTFNIGDYVLTAYNIHTKPSDVDNEMNNLEKIISNKGNVIVLGDLNADCDYYSCCPDFKNWFWQIWRDTTVSPTNCAYDRVILNQDARKEFRTSDVVTEGIDKKLSDHYPVWIELIAKDQ